MADKMPQKKNETKEIKMRSESEKRRRRTLLRHTDKKKAAGGD
jgi:hypothetical protein